MRTTLNYFIIAISLSAFLSCQRTIEIHKEPILVSTEWLSNNLEKPGFVYLQSGKKSNFDSIHIPGFQHISLRLLLTDTNGLRHEFSHIRTMDSVLQSYGITDTSIIVLCYEDEKMIPSTGRLFITLDFLGLGNHTKVVNGGMKQWIIENRPTTNKVTSGVPSTFSIDINTSGFVGTEFVYAALKNNTGLVLDAHDPSMYAGVFDSASRQFHGGHIEGGLNLPMKQMVVDSFPYLFKSDEALMLTLANHGIQTDSRLINYCGTGIYAAVNYMVQKHLGLNPYMYDGSLEAWNKAGLPIILPVVADSI